VNLSAAASPYILQQRSDIRRYDCCVLQPHDFTAHRHNGPAVGVLPLQTGGSYNAVGMQIPPADDRWPVGRPGVRCSPRAMRPSGHCTLLMWRNSCKRIGFFLSLFMTNVFKLASLVRRDNSVGTATRYGLEGPGIESRYGKDFPHLSRPSHPTSCTMCTGSLSRG
jgi:hypothetical protein